MAGGINLYAYTNNNPINYIDPYGLEPCDLIFFDGEPPPFAYQQCVGGGGAIGAGRGARALRGGRSTCPQKSAEKLHKHHTIPREIQKKLPERLRTHKDIIGRKGLPNKQPVEAGRHLNDIHKGPGGGAYNQRFEQEIMKRGGYDRVRVKDVLEIRDNLVKEFSIP